MESNISKSLAFQTRALREREGWSQQYLAEKIGTNQNAVYRAENPNYGKQTITTLKKIAAAFDVALVVRFVPFSELVDWVSGTPRTIAGLTTAALMVPSFSIETVTTLGGGAALMAQPAEMPIDEARRAELLGRPRVQQQALPPRIPPGAELTARAS